MTELVATLPPRAADDPRAYAQAVADAGGDLIEVRGDLTPQLAPFDSPVPILASPRGGDLAAVIANGVAWIDQEAHEPRIEARGARRIASHHDHERCPTADELIAIGRSLRAGTGVELVKIAAHAASARDLEALDAARRTLEVDGPTTVLAMGPFAELDRVRSPWRNALTYAALEERDAAAPGQLTLRDHRRFRGPDSPRVYGLLGGPEACARSASPVFFTHLFGALGNDGASVERAYLRFPSVDAAADLPALERLGVHGLSVTAPHKPAAAAFVRARHGQLSPDAQRAGALNTLVFDERPLGHQFDSAGLELGYRDLGPRAPVAVVGSGGVVPAVLIAAQRLGWREVTIFARDAAARSALSARFDAEHAPLEALADAAPALVVWALPVDADAIALPPAAQGGAAFLDLRYGGETGALARAARAGYAVRDGGAMLVHQALAQFAAFTGREPGPDDARALFALLEDFSATR